MGKLWEETKSVNLAALVFVQQKASQTVVAGWCDEPGNLKLLAKVSVRLIMELD